MTRSRRRRRRRPPALPPIPPHKHALTRRRWRRWIDRVADEAVTPLVVDDQVFRATMEHIAKARSIHPGNHVYRWMIRSYATHIAAGIRRLLDLDTKTFSLLTLLYEIGDNAQVITRVAYVRAYRPIIKDLGHADFDRIAGAGAEHLPAARVHRDIAKLTRARRTIAPVANKGILHLDRHRRRVQQRTWQEFHDVVRLIAQICNDYTLILTGSNNLSPTEPIIVTLHDDLDELLGPLPSIEQ